MAKNIFISSTFRDLEIHRDAVINMLRQTNNFPIAMETFGSKAGDATKVSLEEVQKSDVFLGIYGKRYGYRPDDDKSVTELEYLEAVRLEIPCLIFIVADNYDDPQSLINIHAETDDEGKMLLSIFKRKLNRESVRALFTTPEDLAQKVQNALMNWMQDQLEGMEQTAKDDSSTDGSVNVKQEVKKNTGIMFGNVGGNVTLNNTQNQQDS
ncbi:MAG: DUF4062 domain-containing protein [Aggregatilineales bacterium]